MKIIRNLFLGAASRLLDWLLALILVLGVFFISSTESITIFLSGFAAFVAFTLVCYWKLNTFFGKTRDEKMKN